MRKEIPNAFISTTLDLKHYLLFQQLLVPTTRHRVGGLSSSHSYYTHSPNNTPQLDSINKPRLKFGY